VTKSALEPLYARCAIQIDIFTFTFLDDRSGVQDETMAHSSAADCLDVGCPSGEECQSKTDHGSTRYVCMCPAGFERDANTGHCQLVSKSG